MRKIVEERIRWQWLFIFSLILLAPLVGRAAELNLKSSSINYKVGDTFIVQIQLKVDKTESINAVDVHLKFPSSLLEAKDFSMGNSVLTFINNPIINNQESVVSFSGIIPGGYNGQIPSNLNSNILLGKIIFQAKHKGQATIQFSPSSQVLLNDGKGTKASLCTIPLSLTISLSNVKNKKTVQNQWQANLQKDTTPPEVFHPVIVKINNKYYLSLKAEDKGSGIDHYLVRERSSNSLLPTNAFLSWNCAALPLFSCWHRTQNLYLLKDQSLGSIITVKAVDKAGNIRTATIMPQNYKHSNAMKSHLVLGGIFLLLIVLLLYYLFRFYVKHR